MDLKTLQTTPAWEWPAEARNTILAVLRDAHADPSERLLAVNLAGDIVIMNDELARALLAIVSGDSGTPELRGMAAISLGPALEHADTMDLDDPDDVVLSETTMFRIQQTFHELFSDTDLPESLRRRILEASVRAPQDWHAAAVAAAYAGGATGWKLTSVFCMEFLPGFADRILESLASDDPEIRYHAICAAGNWQIDAAWSHVAEVATASDAEKSLRLAAIGAVAAIRPQEAAPMLQELLDLEDEDIVDAAFEALAMAGATQELDELDELDEIDELDDDESLA